MRPGFDLLGELIGVSQALREAGVEHAVCGGMAMAVHGFARATRDLEILVPIDRAPEAEQAAGRAGFTLSAGEIPFDVGTPRERRIIRVSKARGEDLLTLDLILAAPVPATRTPKPPGWG